MTDLSSPSGGVDPSTSPTTPHTATTCPLDHGCSLPAGHDGDCWLVAALCFCPDCEAKADLAAAVSTTEGTR